MPLTLSRSETRVTLVEPTHKFNPPFDPDWNRVEAVAGRFGLPSHRRAVRVYLYATIRDVHALRTFADDLLYPRKLRNACRRGKALLAEARRLEPDLFDRVMAEFSNSGNSCNSKKSG